MKNKIFIGFLIYGIIIGFLSFWWWHIADSLFLFNIPGILLGNGVYTLVINYLGDPSSAQAHYTIPWTLRVPQAYIPVSIIFWGAIGLVIQVAYRHIRQKRHS